MGRERGDFCGCKRRECLPIRGAGVQGSQSGREGGALWIVKGGGRTAVLARCIDTIPSYFIVGCCCVVWIKRRRTEPRGRSTMVEVAHEAVWSNAGSDYFRVTGATLPLACMQAGVQCLSSALRSRAVVYACSASTFMERKAKGPACCAAISCIPFILANVHAFVHATSQLQ